MGVLRNGLTVYDYEVTFTDPSIPTRQSVNIPRTKRKESGRKVYQHTRDTYVRRGLIRRNVESQKKYQPKSLERKRPVGRDPSRSNGYTQRGLRTPSFVPYH